MPAYIMNQYNYLVAAVVAEVIEDAATTPTTL